MASNIKDGPFIKQGQIRVVSLDTHPWSYTFISESDSTTRKWRLTENNNSVRRVKPVDLTNSVTNYSCSRTFHSHGIRQNSLDGTYGPTAYNAPRIYPPSKDVTMLKAQATSRFRSRVRDEKFDAPTFLAELPETVMWVAKSLRDMYDAYLYVKKGRWLLNLPTAGRKAGEIRRAERPIFRFTHRDGSVYERRFALDKRLANRYLEWRFAVEPIVNDLQGLLAEYHRNSSTPIIRRVTANVSGSFSQNNTYESSSHTVKVTAGAYFTQSLNGQVKARYGINALQTLWNMAPLSFLVDQVYPIGTYLANQDANYGVVYRGKWLSTNERTYVRSKPRNTAYESNSNSELFVKQYTRENRFSNVEELPRFRAPSNALKTALDVLALARSYVK